MAVVVAALPNCIVRGQAFHLAEVFRLKGLDCEDRGAMFAMQTGSGGLLTFGLTLWFRGCKGFEYRPGSEASSSFVPLGAHVAGPEATGGRCVSGGGGHLLGTSQRPRFAATVHTNPTVVLSPRLSGPDRMQGHAAARAGRSSTTPDPSSRVSVHCKIHPIVNNFATKKHGLASHLFT